MRNLKRTTTAPSPLPPIPDMHKLGLAPGQHVLARRTPKEFAEGLRAGLPAEAQLSTRLSANARYDMIFDFPPPEEDFDALFERLQHSLKPDGVLWIVIPNERAARARGVRYRWQGIVDSALKTTLVDNKTLSFSPEEYGTRFVIRKIHRKLAV